MRGWLRAGLLSLLVVACDRTPEATDKAKHSSKQEPAKHAAPPAPTAPPAPALPLRLKAPGRIVAVGDLHGDLASAREALRLAGATDAADRWAGGNLTLVQVGDQLDRGDQEREIVDWLERLGAEAAASGGQVVVLNGNHETMNVAGDLRYVTQAGHTQFAEFARAPTSVAAQVPESARGRFLAFAPGGPYARKLAARNVVVIVDDTLFAHGGVLQKHVRYGLDRINAEVSRWMRGEARVAPESIQSEDSVVWTRAYGDPVLPEPSCLEASAVLKELGVKRMVVAHTPQKRGVSSGCNGQVFRVDVGLSDYYGVNPTQVLAIDGDRVSVLDGAAASAR